MWLSDYATAALFLSSVMDWCDMRDLTDQAEDEPATLHHSHEASWQLILGCVLVQVSWKYLKTFDMYMCAFFK